ncbi:hypothetical protein KKA09_01430 [Patescibacteria group bacterium]|nr:hypothetical protein [Patescibacteria group bacterium]
MVKNTYFSEKNCISGSYKNGITGKNSSRKRILSIIRTIAWIIDRILFFCYQLIKLEEVGRGQTSANF